MANKYRSEEGLFGTIHHYDEKGKEVGRSEPNLFGGFTNYDADGNKVGRSEQNFFGGFTNYDDHGDKIGHSDPDFFDDGYSHYDNHGKKVGSSDPGLRGLYTFDPRYDKNRGEKKDKGEDGGYKYSDTSYSGSSRERKPHRGAYYDRFDRTYWIDGRLYGRVDLKNLGFNYRIIEEPQEYPDYEVRIDELREKLKNYVPDYKDHFNSERFFISLGIGIGIFILIIFRNYFSLVLELLSEFFSS